MAMHIEFKNWNEVRNYGEYLANKFKFKTYFYEDAKHRNTYGIGPVIFSYPDYKNEEPIHYKENYYFLNVDPVNGLAFISKNNGYENCVKESFKTWEIKNENDISDAINIYWEYENNIIEFFSNLNTEKSYYKYIENGIYNKIINDFEVIDETDDYRKEHGILRLYFKDFDKTAILWPNGYVRIYNGNNSFTDRTKTTMKKFFGGKFEEQLQYVLNHFTKKTKRESE